MVQMIESESMIEAVDAVAMALNRIGRALEKLGMDDAVGPMGAVENLSFETKTAGESLSAAVHDGLTEIADAIRSSNDE
jgi:hypothetical protein